jgi:hypothetical protein
MDQFPIARLRYTTATKSWTLFWHDRNLSFHPTTYWPPRRASRISSPSWTATPLISLGLTSPDPAPHPTCSYGH